MSKIARLAWVVALSMPAHVVGGAQAHAADSERPDRIVSLAPHLTELAFSAGAGDLIVATVEYSDFPEAARAIPRIGDAFRIDLERLIAIRPDVVLAWESGTPLPTIERIRTLKFQVETFSTRTLRDVADSVRRLGDMAGTHPIAELAAARFEQEIESLRRQYRGRERVSVFIQIEARPLYTVNGQHVISEIARLCGAENVFAQLGSLAPAIGIEAVIAANPQAIIAIDEPGSDAVDHWRRWRRLDAVRADNLIALDADDLAKPTVRLSNGAAAMCRALDTARENLGHLPAAAKKRAKQ